MNIEEIEYEINKLKNKKITGRRCEVYSRITGYYRPINGWNPGKAQEYIDRKTYNRGIK